MAQFEVLDQEGMNFVKITIENEMVRAERGALCWMTGDIAMETRLRFVGRAITSYLSEESFIRPRYIGTGTIYLESSFAGFHVFEVGSESWILQGGAYWASEGSVDLSIRREKMWASIWAGEGFVDWQTQVTGPGKVVLVSQGPVEEITLEPGRKLFANGKYVVARTANVRFRIERTTKYMVGAYLSGEGYCRSYEGPGRILLSSTPYWRYRMFVQQPQPMQQAAATME
jgi:uncharacterized protein (AIM24 family)